jgi:hypothetical protein
VLWTSDGQLVVFFHRTARHKKCGNATSRSV